jgi:hypothetical protein
MTTIIWITLFREIIGVYSDNHIKPINTHNGENVELLNVNKAGGRIYKQLPLGIQRMIWNSWEFPVIHGCCK